MQQPALRSPPARTHGERTAAPESIKVWPLARCKRFGHPLLSFVKELLPKLAENLSPMEGHLGTGFRTMNYTSARQEWWTIECMMNYLRIREHDQVLQSADEEEALLQVVWNNGLCIALLMTILRQLVMEVHERKTAGTNNPIFTPGESLVFVGFAIIRLKVPFQCL